MKQIHNERREENGRPEYPYFDIYTKDGSDIAFESWTDSRSVGMHQHRYYELLLVWHGSCRHMYRNTETLLIPGDAVIVASHQPHGFSLSGKTLIYNCQFRLEALDPKVVRELSENDPLLEAPDISKRADVSTWETMLQDSEKEAYYQSGRLHESYELNSSKQGVIHPGPMELQFINSVMQHGIDAQSPSDQAGLLAKRKYMEIILLELRRTQLRRNQRYQIYSRANQKAIAAVLIYMEENLSDTLDFNAIAREYAFNPNYFRKIFKDITGLSPVAYINRRFPHGTAFVYDLNYFSRLFKKIMGCPPSKMQ